MFPYPTRSYFTIALFVVLLVLLTVALPPVTTAAQLIAAAYAIVAVYAVLRVAILWRQRRRERVQRHLDQQARLIALGR